MNRDTFESLVVEATKIANHFSNPNRTHNYNKERFEIEEIIPLSETVAGVIYLKNNGLRALSLFLLVNKGSLWLNTFPADSHLLGFEGLKNLKFEVERKNGLKRNMERLKENENEERRK